ncbi:winged helix DNA-binding protein [Stappia sp. F7233]|uniref:Winged helix DNA-binding protein n=1 Tax=Stappia albiluteola TaxID=2758565 RepID=A0A839AFB5_9HYPH|nr:MarR family transcriptional regulator [Stappia albiluteola]MBA5777582.1 winged helix DNA-binding protein [Stappia albiluteola]
MSSSQIRSSSEDTRPSATHLELVRIIERMHRRYLDQLRLELNGIGADDISPAQVMLLFTIGNYELSVRDLLDRGHYLGSNASYNLKQLVQAGYIDRTASQRDRRSARIRLTEKGRQLCLAVESADAAYQRTIVRTENEQKALENTIDTLRRLEVAWATNLHRGELAKLDLL